MKKVISVVAILLVLGLGYWKYYEWKHPQPTVPDKVVGTQQYSGNNLSDGTALSGGDIAKSQSSSINIQLDPVINGTYKGVIEVGASGFNAFVVNIDKDKNWELVSKEFGESLAWEGFANTDDIYTQMKKYISSIASKGVAGRNIQFVVSSGAAKVKNMAMVTDAIKKRGFVVTTVTADQEGKYALKALLPKAYRSNSFTVDIGSGNTKISWFEGDRLKTIECSGAKYYAANPPKTDQDVYNEVVNACNKIPNNMRNNCFVIGGVPYQLAKESKTGNERFTALAAPDGYGGGDDVKKKSGLNIYRAIFETTKCQNYVFDWDANFTIGYLLSMN